MKINKLADITYDTLKNRYKAISNTQIITKKEELNIVQVNIPQPSSRLTSDLYIFDKGQLKFRDITLTSKNGAIKKIETDIIPDGTITSIKDSSAPLTEIIHKKLVSNIEKIRKKQEDGPLINLWYRFVDRNVNRKTPVIITETTKQEGNKEISSFYKILVKGKENKILIKGTETKGIAQLKDVQNNIIEELPITNENAIEDITIINRIFNYFFKKNKGFH